MKPAKAQATKDKTFPILNKHIESLCFKILEDKYQTQPD